MSMKVRTLNKHSFGTYVGMLSSSCTPLLLDCTFHGQLIPWPHWPAAYADTGTVWCNSS